MTSLNRIDELQNALRDKESKILNQKYDIEKFKIDNNAKRIRIIALEEKVERLRTLVVGAYRQGVADCHFYPHSDSKDDDARNISLSLDRFLSDKGDMDKAWD